MCLVNIWEFFFFFAGYNRFLFLSCLPGCRTGGPSAIQSSFFLIYNNNESAPSIKQVKAAAQGPFHGFRRHGACRCTLSLLR